MTIVAIDFGTSNTVVSVLETSEQTPKTLHFSGISRRFYYHSSTQEKQEVSVVPSLVYVAAGQKIVIGEKVRSQRLGLTHPQRLFKAFKRDLAADFPMPPRTIDDQEYEAKIVAEAFLNQIWSQVQKLGIEPSELIFTVPVGAYERYITWFRDWVATVGVEKVRFVDESSAAALGYSVQRPGSLVLVVDFGGGTLDLSLVRTQTVQGEEESLQAQIIAKTDAYIGGEDIDIWIIEDYLRKQGLSRENLTATSWQNLLEISERLKIQLSEQEEVRESWLDEETFTAYDLQLTRSQLGDILEENQFLEQLREAIDEVITVALGKGINKSDIEQVLLVGGSSLIPPVQRLIKLYFGRSKVKLDKPFEAVCHGALSLPKLSQLEDYLRHSYAIRLWEPVTKSYTYFTLFEKGESYPCQREELLTLQVAKDGQKEIRLDIGELAEFNQAEVTYNELGIMSSSKLHLQSQYRPLGSHRQEVCVAHLNPSGHTGMDRISVEFEVDEKRVLLATVKDLLTHQVLVERGAIAKLR